MVSPAALGRGLRTVARNGDIFTTVHNFIVHLLIFSYDMRSQLTDANITNIGGSPWAAKYIYHDNGNMAYRIIQSDSQSFSYTGHQMTNADGNTLDYDENGNLVSSSHESQVTSHEYNWDGKLRSATKAGAEINLKYDPYGNRIKKTSSVSGTRKYIVDIVGDLPVILVVLDNSQNILNRYIYSNSQIVAQHDVTDNNKLYFYLNDRLGSVRMLMDTDGAVQHSYTYNPFGEVLESGHGSQAPNNCFMFTGQYYDSEIDEYYLRARQYDPYIYRFTSRDSIIGQFEQPLTLHTYLYCINDPVNRIDLTGELALLSSNLMGNMWRAAVRNAMWGAISGALSDANKGFEEAILGAARGFAGGFAGGAIYAGSLSSIGYVSKFLSPQIAANMMKYAPFVSGGIGSAVNTLITSMGEEAFITEMFSSVLVGSVFGGTGIPLSDWLPQGLDMPNMSKNMAGLTTETLQFLFNIALAMTIKPEVDTLDRIGEEMQ